MKREDLQKIFEIAIDGLKVNRETLGDGTILDTIDSFVKLLEVNPQGLPVSGQFDLQKTLDTIKKLVEFERKLLADNSDQKIINAIERVQGRPLIMMALSTLL